MHISPRSHPHASAACPLNASSAAHPGGAVASQHALRLAMLGLAVAMLAACGGGDDGPAVASIDATAPLAFGKQAVFTVVGPGLESSQVAVTTTGCKGLALVAGSTATSKQVACTVTGVAEVKLETKAADGTPLLARTFAVPAPKVELRTSMGTVVLDLYPAKAPATALPDTATTEFYVNLQDGGRLEQCARDRCGGANSGAGAVSGAAA